MGSSRHEVLPLLLSARMDAAADEGGRRGSKKGELSKPRVCEDLEQGMAVYLNFPINTVDQIEHVHPHHKTITKEFWYDGGRVAYDGPGEAGPGEAPLKYARLVTKSSMYEELAWALLAVSLSISALVAQVTFAARCLVLWYNQTCSKDEPWQCWMLEAYPVLFFMKCGIWISVSCVQVQRRFSLDAAYVGDFVQDVCAWELRKTKVCAVFFQLFSVPEMLTEAAVMLHVRKPVQPYVAFKAKHRRAWILGWTSKEHYAAVNGGGAINNLRLAVIFELPLLLLQLSLKIAGLEDISFVMVLTFGLSLALLLAKAWQLHALATHRSKLHAWLRGRTSGGLPEADARGEQAVKELVVNHRDLRKHFGEEIPADVCARAQQLGFGA